MSSVSREMLACQNNFSDFVETWSKINWKVRTQESYNIYKMNYFHQHKEVLMYYVVQILETITIKHVRINIHLALACTDGGLLFKFFKGIIRI